MSLEFALKEKVSRSVQYSILTIARLDLKESAAACITIRILTVRGTDLYFARAKGEEEGEGAGSGTEKEESHGGEEVANGDEGEGE